MDHIEITTSGRRALELGSRLGKRGTLAVGAEGEGLAWMLARCAGCGAALSGGRVLFHDGSTAAAGLWLARHYRLSASLYFMELELGAGLMLRDGQGKPLPETELPPASDWAGASGNWDRLAGTDDAYAAHLVGDRRAEGMVVTVLDHRGQKPLVKALERLGCDVLNRPRPGVPLLRTDQAGFRLVVREGTSSYSPAGRDGVAAAVDWCLAKALAVPAFGKENGAEPV